MPAQPVAAGLSRAGPKRSGLAGDGDCLTLLEIPAGRRNLRHLVREVGDNSHLLQLAVHVQLNGVALRLAAWRGVQFGAHDLQVGVVARQQAAQKMKIAFVELLFGADGGVETSADGRQADPACDLLHDVGKRNIAPVLRAAIHTRGLESIFGEHD